MSESSFCVAKDVLMARDITGDPDMTFGANRLVQDAFGQRGIGNLNMLYPCTNTWVATPEDVPQRIDGVLGFHRDGKRIIELDRLAAREKRHGVGRFLFRCLASYAFAHEETLVELQARHGSESFYEALGCEKSQTQRGRYYYEITRADYSPDFQLHPPNW